MKSITTNVYTFEKLIQSNCVYVDKTAEIHKLLGVFSGQFFLSRPRRFGKSLLISTLKAIFQGKRELFKGLAIDSLDYDWKTYPVIHLDMGSSQAATVEDFTINLQSMLASIEREYGLEPEKGLPPSARFKHIVEALAAQSPEGSVVILVDEYDKPLLGHLGQKEVLKFRDELKSFYSVIKTTEALQRFAFITGVSKFSKVSIFSDLNNLIELTMSASAATLLGYTKEELLANFSEHIQQLADAMNSTFDEAVDKLAEWYDGYKFHPCGERMFNPVSIGKCLSECEIKNYWFDTSTPTFLVDLLKKNVLNLDTLTVKEKDFSTYEVENPSVLALLLQTGYLTIKSTEGMLPTDRRYTLDFPNLEVRNSFNDYLLAGFAHIQDVEETQYLDAVLDAIRADDINKMLETMKFFFCQIPHDLIIQQEKYYQTIFYSLFTLIGVRMKAEVHTNIGSIDAVIERPHAVWIFEFKLNSTSKAAMKQIHEKKYYEKYLASGKEIKLIGAAFSKKTRNLSKWIVEGVH